MLLILMNEFCRFIYPFSYQIGLGYLSLVEGNCALPESTIEVFSGQRSFPLIVPYVEEYSCCNSQNWNGCQ